MQHTILDEPKPQPSYQAKNALVGLPDFQNQKQFTNSILEAAENAGCEFLFEIPASLFGFEDTRAAAIRLNISNENNRLAFILCDIKTGTVHVLSNDEVPEAVNRFVESYACVLGFLKASNITFH